MFGKVTFHPTEWSRLAPPTGYKILQRISKFFLKNLKNSKLSMFFYVQIEYVKLKVFYLNRRKFLGNILNLYDMSFSSHVKGCNCCLLLISFKMVNELFIQATTILASVATYWCDTIKRRVMVYDRHYNKRTEYKYWACRDLYAGFNCVVHCNLEWKI